MPKPKTPAKEPLFATLIGPVFKTDPYERLWEDGSHKTSILQDRLGRAGGAPTKEELLKMTGLIKHMAKDRREVGVALSADRDLAHHQQKLVEQDYHQRMGQYLNQWKSWRNRTFYRPLGIEVVMVGLPVNDNPKDDIYFIQFFREAKSRRPVMWMDPRHVAAALAIMEKRTRKISLVHAETIESAEAFRACPGIGKDIKHIMDSVIRCQDVPRIEFGKR